jgi:uncharacterized protein YlxW (UPF0749 family)
VTVPERAPAFSAEASAISAGICVAVELLQGFALHLQFHLRIVLEAFVLAAENSKYSGRSERATEPGKLQNNLNSFT